MLRRNVLILHAGALGDFILTWPLTLALARLYPQSRIFCVTHATKGALASSVLGVESANIEVGWHALYAGEAPPEPVQRLLAGAHTIINFMSSADHRFVDTLRQVAGDQVDLVTLEPTPPPGFLEHATRFHLSQLAARPAMQAALEQMLRRATGSGLRRQIVPGTEILLHPGSGSPTKNWPLDKFLDLAEGLKNEGTVKALVGEVELERFDDSALQRLERSLPVIRCPKIAELLAAVGRAKLYIGNDSGPTHLAGILGVATLALFGPTEPRVWSPLGPHVQMICQNPLETLEVRKVLPVALALMNQPSSHS